MMILSYRRLINFVKFLLIIYSSSSEDTRHKPFLLHSNAAPTTVPKIKSGQ
jgi:hypothetical protein